MTKPKITTTVSRDDPRRGRTDWKRVDRLTDEEIEAAMRSDEDAPPDFDFDDAVPVTPRRAAS